ncbi:MAG TPA: hypothetical protein DCM27_02100 [Rhodospirillaceae bacterium]|nr:hypothetical protein [Rhodospirillaceae bacterium]
MNAVKLYNNGVAGGSYASYVRNYQANQIYTYSVYAKKAELPNINLRVHTAAGWAADGDVVFDLNAGTTTVNGTGVSSYKITALPNGWYRCSITATFGAVNQTGQYPIISINGPTDGVSGTYLYGAQLEQGAYATSYIPTATTSMTRAADSFTLPSAPWSSTNGREAVFAQLDAQIPQSSWASIFNPGLFFSGNRYLLLGSNGTISGGYSGTNITTSAIASSLTSFKAGTSFTSTNTYTALNGSVTTGPLVGSSSPATTGIGVGDVKYLNGHLQILKYYPLPLSDTQLQLLTQ